MIPLSHLNSCAPAEFVAALGGIFEHSPWVAERALAHRPFDSRLALHEAMCAQVQRASGEEQLALIRAHPELAGRSAERGELTVNSTREQKGAGLADCTAEDLTRIRALNARYRERFGFPFVLAVKGHHTASIIAALERRMNHDVAEERAVALGQIGRIAGFRLADLIDEPIGTQILAMTAQLAQYSEQEGVLTCSYLTSAHRQTAERIKDWMLAAGLSVHIDAVGNVVGKHAGSSATARTLLTGSHYDTVVNAGRYDGRLGIALPIAVVERLRRAGTILPFPLEIIAFAEEEGVRFKSTFLGSSAVAGRFDPGVLESRDAQGVSMREAMRAAGLDPAAIPSLARRREDIAGFVEVHIEQGPVLLSENIPLGVVTSIAGSTRALVTIVGESGHAGTVPMNLRHDAAAAAAELVLFVEARCASVEGLVGTVGQLDVVGGAVNVIPGRCELSLDVRSGDDAVRRAAFEEVVAELGRISARRGVQSEWRKVLEIDAVPCDGGMQARWSQSVARVTGSVTPRQLPSGAGHDAMMMASIGPMGMLFVRCGNGGVSHNPAESLDAADAQVAAQVFEDFLTHFSSEQ